MNATAFHITTHDNSQRDRGRSTADFTLNKEQRDTYDQMIINLSHIAGNIDQEQTAPSIDLRELKEKVDELPYPQNPRSNINRLLPSLHSFLAKISKDGHIISCQERKTAAILLRTYEPAIIAKAEDTETSQPKPTGRQDNDPLFTPQDSEIFN